jgi:hypothetical protein
MWAPRDTSAGTSRASSPGREETRVVADTRTDLLGCVDGCSVFSEAHRGLRREDENAEDWRVGGFDVFERRTSPLRRKRAPLVPGEFDHDELVRRALERARVDVKAVGSAHLATEITPRIPLKALVPGNAGLHRGVAEHRAGLVRERSISRGLSFDDVKINSAVTVSATVSATTESLRAGNDANAFTAERLDERHSPSVASSAWSAESNASRVELLESFFFFFAKRHRRSSLRGLFFGLLPEGGGRRTHDGYVSSFGGNALTTARRRTTPTETKRASPTQEALGDDRRRAVAMVRARRAGKPPVEDALCLAFETRNVCRLARRRRRGGFVGGAQAGRRRARAATAEHGARVRGEERTTGLGKFRRRDRRRRRRALFSVAELCASEVYEKSSRKRAQRFSRGARGVESDREETRSAASMVSRRA